MGIDVTYAHKINIIMAANSTKSMKQIVLDYIDSLTVQVTRQSGQNCSDTSDALALVSDINELRAIRAAVEKVS